MPERPPAVEAAVRVLAAPFGEPTIDRARMERAGDVVAAALTACPVTPQEATSAARTLRWLAAGAETASGGSEATLAAALEDCADVLDLVGRPAG